MKALKIIGKILLGLVALIAAFVLFVWLMPAQVNSASIDFTRHLGQYTQAADDSVASPDSFFGVPGNARMIVSTSGEAVSASIELNGTVVAGPDSFGGSAAFEVPVSLEDSNTISVTVDAGSEASVSVRVKQMADLELHVGSRIHFNTNVSDFVAAREFYGNLGFGTLSGFPDTNTEAMARAIGIETPTSYDGSKGDWAGGYLLHGELIGMGGFSGGLIDLIEFTIPRNEEAPYAQVNHLGMAKAAMNTTDIAADYQTMKDLGVEFIAAPTARADGTLFAIFSDLDGTFYELVEVADEESDNLKTNITKLSALTINVSDFDRSREFYRMLGYSQSKPLPATSTLEEAQAYGFDRPFKIRGADLSMTTGDKSMIRLVQWLDPADDAPPYPPPISHLGINRMAVAVENLDDAVAVLSADGQEFLSEIAPCCSATGLDETGIVHLIDPDGVFIELVGAIVPPVPPPAPPDWCPQGDAS
jgi:catechol 2,3-dioxygenase-like lactoylglutathione lyase family enzyme